MAWEVSFHPEFSAEFEGFNEIVQDALIANLIPLARFGPLLGRPTVDTLKGSAISNLKELRFTAGAGVWRVAFAFDGSRVAVLLASGDKRGQAQAKFYRNLIKVAERRWETWE